jgi:predicted metal-dependent hydrolase
MYLKKISSKRKQRTKEIILNGIDIIVTRKNIKNLRLSVSPLDGSVKIFSPLLTSDKYINDFVLSKIKWIEKHQKKVLFRGIPPMLEYISGENHFFKGELYTLNVIFEDKKPVVLIHGNSLMLSARPGSTIEKRKQILNDWYRTYLKEQIPLLIEKWTAIIGASPLDWGVKNMKTRWGSCNTSDKRIWLSLKLAEKSESCLEYVFVHEMVHLLERGHGKPFIAYMDRVIPEWIILRDDLNRTQSIN